MPAQWTGLKPVLQAIAAEASRFQVDEWVKLTVREDGGQVFTVERVPFAS